MRREELLIFDSADVREKLHYADCINLVRDAMMALSAGTTKQLLRSILELSPGRAFAQMPGALGENDLFGAKIISVFPDKSSPGIRRHRGVVMLFEPDEGRPVAIADAEEITHIRTAAATAMATDALARKNAENLLIIGTGGQARTHLKALPLVRNFRQVHIWGRDPAKAQALAEEFASFGTVAVTDIANAAAQADVICTLTGASQPILSGEWVRPGTHVNLVGSSVAGPVEVDNALVLAGRYIADSRASALAAAAEFLVAKQAGLIDDNHIVAEIGEVLLGRAEGRRNNDDITLYKSLGHAVQDLAAAACLYRSSLKS